MTTRIKLGFTADTNGHGNVTTLAAQGWPDGWPIPATGDTIDLPDVQLEVKRVVYMPLGTEEKPGDPLVYVVVGMSA
jgi:hypothetical protein